MFHMVPVRFFLLNSSFELRWKPVSLCLQHQSWQRSRAWPDTCSERTEPFSKEEEKRPRTYNNRVGPLKPQITDTSSTTSPVVTAEAHIRDPEEANLKPAGWQRSILRSATGSLLSLSLSFSLWDESGWRKGLGQGGIAGGRDGWITRRETPTPDWTNCIRREGVRERKRGRKSEKKEEPFWEAEAGAVFGIHGISFGG